MTSTEVAELDQVAQEIAAHQAEEYGDEEFLQTPILKVGQALTKEVQDGDASPGEFINTLTGEALGDVVEFIQVYYNRGRFASDKKTNKAYVAFDDVIPANWGEYLGENWVGEAFSEHPESEEAFKAAVKAKEREWDHGPGISTTHNFTGLLIVEGEDGNDYQPVRLSLKRTDVPAARKILTLLRMTLANKPPWDTVLKLSTTQKDSGGHKSFIINPSGIKLVRPTESNERQLGSQLALAVVGGRTNAVGDEADAPVEPKDSGGLKV